MNLMLATIIVVVAMCDAEPPRFRHFQRQAVQPSNPEAAPYPPSGYRPAGAQFALPQKEYGAPAPGYGPPDTNQQPQATTTELPETTTTNDEEGTTLEPQAENIKEETNKNRPVFLVVPRAQQVRSQSYITYVQEYPEVVDEPEELVFEQNAAIYNSKLQAVPVESIYNPYAYFQIYQ
ncbi:uncharacterized protein [Atheta coriaria]|uniref:uncharacterized protein isoform X2 n=1 Tax=Dalotia coriaria TaxID=877792 RepID=UPI0031F39A46